ncbi:hypothetical protein GCM10007989_20090 [Devosia pacifica]|uniref:Activator of Hsp90 ATPase homologue 1/2-like C-terminal domain-containing protein n=1 Tax=Devosia pacifica TaxID=1335967 RepID=A0A918VUK2_9HYPH|nr:SRPBCC family protein [Devosia pacifica]GHA24403.1 hypothetical protein GCM10007989_20090 [Devosia pacifica]
MSNEATLEAKVTHHFSADPDTIFMALTQEETVRRWHHAWLGAMGLPDEVVRCDVDAREGGSFEMIGRRDEDEIRHAGRFEVLDRPKRLRFNWSVGSASTEGGSTVTIILETAPDEDGTNATLYQELPNASEEAAAQAEQGWLAMLGAIDGTLRKMPQPDSDA